MEHREHRGALKIHFAICKMGVNTRLQISNVVHIFVAMQSRISVQQIRKGLYFIIGSI